MSMPDLKKDWQAPDNWIKIKAIDAHTAGEPLRVITNGFPELPGKTILEKDVLLKKIMTICVKR